MTDDPAPIDDLAPIDDEVVTAFRRLLARVRSSETLNDVDAINKTAAENVAELRDIIIRAGLADQIHHRFRLEAASDDGANPDWPDDAKEARRLLLGAVRVMGELGPALMPGWVPSALIADWYATAQGDPPLIGSRIPASNRRSKRPLLGDQLKAQVVRLSHYNAGLKGTDWETEMRLIYSAGSVGGGTHRGWNRLISDDERQTYRQVGALKRAGFPLSQNPGYFAEQATLYTPDELREMLKSLL
jgi:hypothetical protein